MDSVELDLWKEQKERKRTLEGLGVYDLKEEIKDDRGN